MVPFLILGAGLVVTTKYSEATTEVVVNLNVKHSVNGKETFERRNHIKLHSTLLDSDWNGEEDKLQYMMEDLDVYFGRDNGGTVWNFNQADQDPNNSGYAEPGHIVQRGMIARENTWGIGKADLHKYDGRGDIMVGGQPRQHFLGKTSPCCGDEGWQTNGGDAVGDFLGQFVNEFFRLPGQAVTEGHLSPTYLEVLNEPLYQLTDAPHELGLEDPVPPLEVFEFHNQVAEGFRRHNTDVKIGGFTVAFPIFEERNFSRWEERMKLFIDQSGEYMDFYSTHFYDLEDDNRFKGSRIEATLDMIDNYSLITLGEKKEHVISEYGGRNRPIEKQAWSPLRDWWFLKTASPMLLQFMDRPDSVTKSIPFVPVKALWGTSADGTPYNWRLLRQRSEAPNETGNDWVFTEMVKFYELWSDVKGTRVDSFSTNSDILVDSYVIEDKAYVIFSNLTEKTEKILLHKYGMTSANVESVKIKHLYLNGSAPKLQVDNISRDNNEFDLAPEATIIAEFDYNSDIVIDELSEEHKYYATEYLKPIVKDVANSFSIPNVTVNNIGETILRIAVGRDLSLSLAPSVTFNGSLLQSEAQISGDIENVRGSFFGVLEIPVPNSLLSNVNTIGVTFPDDGGHIASVNMKAFNFSKDIRPTSGPVEGIFVEAAVKTLAIGDTTEVTTTVTPFFASNQNFTLSSSNPNVATVSQDGEIVGVQAGEVTITAVSEDGNFAAQTVINVEAPLPTSIIFDDSSIYANTVYQTGGVMSVTTQYEAGTGHTVTNGLGGVDYRLRHVTSNYGLVSDIAIVRDDSAIGTQRGTSTVDIPLPASLTPSAELENGEFYFLFVRVRSSSGETKSVSVSRINIESAEVNLEPSLTLDDATKYTSTVYSTNDSMQVIANFEAGEGNTVTDQVGGVRFFLRELNSGFQVVNDNIMEDASTIGMQTGTASATFSLAQLTPSSELPEGNFYYLFATFFSSDGAQRSIEGLFPIQIEQGSVEPSLTFDDPSIYRITEYTVGDNMSVSVNYEAGTGKTISSGVGGVRFFLRHLSPGFNVVQDIAIVEDASAIGQQSGIANANISLANAIPTSELPEGHFYFLFVLMESSDGSRQNVSISNINIVSNQIRGDYDGDGDVDINDVRAFVADIQARQSIDLQYDLNDDNVVNALDARLMMNLCTRTRCAP